jgi:hypothetical protein
MKLNADKVKVEKCKREIKFAEDEKRSFYEEWSL